MSTDSSPARPEPELTPPPAPSIRGGSAGSGGPPVGANEGDWTCADCANVNFARRSACNRCGKGRTPVHQKKKKLGQEIGKQAAEKSRGLFSADDWQCNKCGNVNWARRMHCNVCNAPKFGEVEERTGFGGGYNDRGVVEYKERVDDSDDEYDEFGRRKKKKSGSRDSRESDNGYRASPPPKEAPVEVSKEEDEEEDDEDDDDGDLSKYDLSDWGEVKPAATTERRRSRSRTRSRSPVRRD